MTENSVKNQLNEPAKAPVHSLDRVKILDDFRHDLSTALYNVTTASTIKHAEAMWGLGKYEQALLTSTPPESIERDIREKEHMLYRLQSMLLECFICHRGPEILLDSDEFAREAAKALEQNKWYCDLRTDILKLKVSSARTIGIDAHLTGQVLILGPPIVLPACATQKSTSQRGEERTPSSQGSSTRQENISVAPPASRHSSVLPSPLDEDPVATALRSCNEGKRYYFLPNDESDTTPEPVPVVSRVKRGAKECLILSSDKSQYGKALAKRCKLDL